MADVIYCLNQKLITVNTWLKLWALWLIYTAGYGLGYRLILGFLFYTEVGSRDPSLSLCNVNLFCIVQCSHQVWNPNLYPSSSLSM